MTEPIIECDENGNLIHYKNSKGYEYWEEYDKKGNCIHTKDSDGREEWWNNSTNPDEHCLLNDDQLRAFAWFTILLFFFPVAVILWMVVVLIFDKTFDLIYGMMRNKNTTCGVEFYIWSFRGANRWFKIFRRVIGGIFGLVILSGTLIGIPSGIIYELLAFSIWI